MNEIILSICISSYNNTEHLYHFSKDFIEKDFNNIELIINDNCSTDAYVNNLQELKSYNYHFYKNNSNIGPIKNYMYSIFRSTGKYCIFLTDKDFFDLDNINNFINLLISSKASFGYVELNYDQSNKIETTNTCIDSLLKFSYLSKHPSGYFFKRELLDNNKLLKEYSDENIVSCYPFEFICADLSLNYIGAIISIKLINTKKLSSVSKSSTYSSANNNLFFMWKKRIDTFLLYTKHLFNLNISNSIKNKVLNSLLIRTKIFSTIEYKNLLIDPLICSHYKTKLHKVTVLEIIFILQKINIEYLFLKTQQSIFTKINLIICSDFKVYSMLIKYYLQLLKSQIKNIINYKK